MPALAPSITVPTLASGLELERPSDAVAIEAMVLASFGPGRFAKTAERLREAAAMVAGFVAREGGNDGARLTGSVRLWSIAISGTPGLFLGPIIVDPDNRKSGLGADLVAACIAHAKAIGTGGILLVGDHAYFQRFGFEVAADVRLPGPADPRRVLWLPVTVETVSGMVRAVT